MKNIFLKDILPHIVAIILFILVPLLYFSPLLNNKVLNPIDVRQWKASAKEIIEYREDHGKEVLWTNRVFAGMPAYQISFRNESNLTSIPFKILNLNLNKPVNIVFISLFGFYILLLAFRVNPWLSMTGALAYAFSSYFFIILDAGHITKAQALGFLPPIIAGIYLAYRGKLLLGAALTGIFLALQLYVNHLQITYYTLLIILGLGITELIRAIREKTIPVFLTTSLILIVVAALAVGTRAANLLTTYEYTQHSTRGKSELTLDEENKTRGLDKDYVTGWSYGITETLSLFIPNIKGGTSMGPLGENSATYDLLKKIQGPANARKYIRNMPLYWGKQPITFGPVYVGAVVLFLFVFGLFAYKGRLKWLLVILTLLSIMLAWGRNFMPLTSFFLDYFPMYNKFRTVTMILIIAEFTIPLLAFLALMKLVAGNIKKDEFYRALKYSFFILGGLALFFVLFPGIFNFTGPNDNFPPEAREFYEALKSDRKMLLRNDALRSLLFVSITAGILYFFFRKKLTQSTLLISLAALILLDMWTVNKRYLNHEDFVSKRQGQEAFQPLQADLSIMEDEDPYFRVFDLTANPFSSARASNFHYSIGGYHGAKLQRYNELITYHISQNNMDVLNMLNTKYFIVPQQQGQPVARRNPGALGNAWLVSDYRLVENADQEIAALENFNPSATAIIDEQYRSYLENTKLRPDTNAFIRLMEYAPNRLVYEVRSSTEQVAVFSEIYYPHGWTSYIDGEEVPHFRVNYVLRAMVVPPGQHEIVFEFRPDSYYTGTRISLVSSSLLLLFFTGIIIREIFLYFRKMSSENPED